MPENNDTNVGRFSGMGASPTFGTLVIVRTFQRKPTGRPPTWEPESLEEAIAAYQAGSASVRSAKRDFGIPSATLLRHLRLRGIPVRSGGLPGVKGDQHPAWKGGQQIDRDGYVRTYAPDHPWPRRGGYVPEHVRRMELSLGRRMTPDENVHHLNHDRQDNRLENLAVMLKGSHSSHHRSLDQHLRERDEHGRFV